MKIIKFVAIVPVLLAVGCAHHPRYTAVAVPAPAKDVVVVPAPVSDRSVVRVYPDAPVGIATLPAGVSATEHRIAESIRAMFNTDPAWAGLTDRVEVRVSDTTIDLNGTVASDSIRDRIEQKVRALSGVTDVDNNLRVVTP